MAAGYVVPCAMAGAKKNQVRFEVDSSDSYERSLLGFLAPSRLLVRQNSCLVIFWSPVFLLVTWRGVFTKLEYLILNH
jgi:hypothetical protein